MRESPKFHLAMTSSALHHTLEIQKGILFVKPAIVFRGAYSGRNIVAKNSELSDIDDRGYYPG